MSKNDAAPGQQDYIDSVLINHPERRDNLGR